MHNKGTWPIRLWFGALALIGMVAGHQVSFFLAERQGEHRHALLQATGHGSWASVNAIAAAVGLAVLVGFIGASIRSAQSRRQRRAGYMGALGRLAPLQLATFVGVEAVERISAGSSLAEILSDRIILIGLLVQVVVAALACLVLLLVSHVVASLIRAVHEVSPVADTLTDLPRPAIVRLDLSRVAWSLRGPPLTSM